MRKKSLGETLREARVEKEFSLYDVETSSGIEAQYLLALEMDQLKAIPEELQRKSVEQYAKVVGLDGVRLYREQLENEKQEKKARTAVNQQLERDLEARNILSRFSKHKREEKRKSAYIPLLILSLVSLIIIFSVGYIVYRHLSHQTQVINSPSGTAVNHLSTSQENTMSHSISEVTVSGVNVTKTVRGKTLSLAFSNLEKPVKVIFKLVKDNSETWMSVSNVDSSRSLLISEKEQDNVALTVDESSLPTLVTLGDASQVELKLNDQSLDLSELTDGTLSYITLTMKKN